jgi:hypothetical protein
MPHRAKKLTRLFRQRVPGFAGLGFPLAWLLYLVFEFVFFGALTGTGSTPFGVS